MLNKTRAIAAPMCAAFIASAAFAGGSCTYSKTAQSQCGSSNAGYQVVQAGHHSEPNIIQIASTTEGFGTLTAAITAAGLADALQGEGPFTVFAPTDDAFAKLPAGTVESLLRPENRETLVSILKFHVVPGRVMAKDVVKVTSADTLMGQRVDVNVDGGNVTINGANVIATDVTAGNGVIHVIDTVILPEDKNILSVAAEANMFNTLAAALGAAELTSALEGDGPFTVLAPTDEAFAKLPAGTIENLLKVENRDQLRAILLYHVIEGRVYSDQAINAKKARTLQGSKVKIKSAYGSVKINDAKVIAADIDATNGVIHVIDTVLLPPSH